MSGQRKTVNLSTLIALLMALVASAGCGPAIADEEAAERAVVGLERAINRVIDLGFVAFNAADSANIAETSDDGDESGTLTIGGQIDQGNSDNKGMRLDVTLVEYSDGDVEDTAIAYDSPEGDPADVDLDLRDVPDGTLEGTWLGTFVMSGDLSGPVELELALAGNLVAGEDDAVLLDDGATSVTGTATSDFGVFDVDFSF